MNERFTVLKSDSEIRARIQELAAEISKDYQHIRPENPLLVLCTLRGAVFFAADLVRKLTVPAEIDFLKVHSYQGTRPAVRNNTNGTSEPLLLWLGKILSNTM